MKFIIKDFVVFFKSPIKVKPVQKGDIFVYFFGIFILFFVTLTAYSLFEKIISATFNLHVDYKNISTDLYKSKLPPFVYYLATLIIVPVIEEIIFRLGLSFKKYHIIISVAVLSFTIIGAENWFIGLPLSAIIAGTVIKFVPESFFKQLKLNYGNIIIYGIIILFSLAHLLNLYQLGIFDWNIYVFYFFSILIGSIFLMFTRLRLGFLYSIILHILLNCMSTTGAIMSSASIN